MRKLFSLLVIVIIILAACGEEKVHFLEVDFDVPEHVEVGETVELKAIVSYGGKAVKDANEVLFEVWEKNDRDNAKFYDGVNNKDGTYTYEVSFDKDGIFEMYAHTTARDQHNMPLKEIIVGEGGEYEDADLGYHTEGFDMHFMEIDQAKVGEEVDLIVHIMLNEEHLADANVRYEIWHDEDEVNKDWVDAKEETDEYSSTYTFEKEGTYHIQVHVENDDLHEYNIYSIEVE